MVRKDTQIRVDPKFKEILDELRKDASFQDSFVKFTRKIANSKSVEELFRRIRNE